MQGCVEPDEKGRAFLGKEKVFVNGKRNREKSNKKEKREGKRVEENFRKKERLRARERRKRKYEDRVFEQY